MQRHLDTPLVESNAVACRPGQRAWLNMDALRPSGSFKLRGIGHACAAGERFDGFDGFDDVLAIVCGGATATVAQLRAWGGQLRTPKGPGL